MAEKGGGFGGPAGLEQLTDTGGRNLAAARHRHRVESVDAETLHLAHIGEHGGVARPALAEAEIGPHQHASHFESLDQHFEHEILGALLRHLGVEIEREHDLDAKLRQKPRLDAKGRQPELRGAGMEEFLGMRFEGDHAQRGAEGCGMAGSLGDQRPVAQMHAVEIAKRHHRAMKGSRNPGVMAKDAHGRCVKLSQAQAA